MTPTPTARQALRTVARARRKALSPDERARAEAAAQRTLLEHPAVLQAPTVALYRAFDGEVDTTWLALQLALAGQRVLYARARPAAPLEFVRAERWTTGWRDLPVPEGPAFGLCGADVIVVPGLAFDDGGFRLGFGGGYYDRTLAECPALAIGLAFECQRVPRVPRAGWDQPVSALATERRLYTFSRQGTFDRWST